MNLPLLDELRTRALVQDVTEPEALAAHLGSGARTMYVGFDPTADSLHVGSLLPLLVLRRVQLSGHRPIVLVGGGTGLIGDPSGKIGERALNPTDVVQAWAARLKQQVARFVDFDAGAGAAILVDNYDWISRLDLVSFLRDIGKHFGVGAMLARESVRSRLGRSDGGISYTEFSYQVLQAYDFLCLYQRHGCTVQLGGSDQWGNITAGVDLVRRIEGATTYGVTLPLVTKADGTKFGKTESGTVWLDGAKTSPYEMYQFWLNVADADVVRFLRFFTFLSAVEIEGLRLAAEEAPERREAQRVLAREVTRLVHGEAALREAERITLQLFDVHRAALEDTGALPGAVLAAEASPRPVWRVLKEAGLVSSTSEARRLIQQGGVEVNRERVSDLNAVLSQGAYTIRLGKRRVFRVVIQG